MILWKYVVKYSCFFEGRHSANREMVVIVYVRYGGLISIGLAVMIRSAQVFFEERYVWLVTSRHDFYKMLISLGEQRKIGINPDMF